jgi:hypothetical protein
MNARALGELAVGADQRIGLPLDLRCHAVEGAIEQADFVGSGATGDAQRVVAAADFARCRDQFGEGLYLPVGKPQRKPDRQAD